MIENKNLADEPLTYQRLRRCLNCRALSRLTHSLLDSRHGYTVDVYTCFSCGDRIWDEAPKSRVRSQ